MALDSEEFRWLQSKIAEGGNFKIAYDRLAPEILFDVAKTLAKIPPDVEMAHTHLSDLVVAFKLMEAIERKDAKAALKYMRES